MNVVRFVPAGICVGLGVWQLRRLEWKRGVLEDQAAQLSLPALALTVDDHPSSEEWDSIEYRRVTATGTFDTSKTCVVEPRFPLQAAAAAGPSTSVGAHIICPLVLSPPSSSSTSLVAVNLGYVDKESADSVAVPEGQVRVTGMARASPPPDDKDGFSSAPQAQRSGQVRPRWTRVDARAMSDHWGIGYTVMAIDAERVEVLDRKGAVVKVLERPLPGQTNLTIKNDHAEYAATWFTLSAALVVAALKLKK
jgi:surfeit locus 1 family protein